MKILQVIDTLNVGGAERVFTDMCNILHSNKLDVSILFLLDGGILEQDLNIEITTIELHRKNKWSLVSMYKCSKIINQYDIVHCHFRHVYRYISLVAKLFSVNVKIILQDHYGSIDIDKNIPFLFTSIFKPKHYIGVSNTLTNWATNSLKMKSENVFLLENIIIKQKINFVENKKVDLLLVSNIKPVKNNFFAVEIGLTYFQI